MIKYLNTLKSVCLFRDLSEDAILLIVRSKACFLKSCKKGISIYGFHRDGTFPGIILEGAADVLQPSVQGHEVIVNRLTAGSSFGFSYACAGEENRINDIRCVVDSQILFMDISMLLKGDCLPASLETQLLKNLLQLLAEGAIILNSRVQVLGQKTLKEKLLTYFEQLVEKSGSRKLELDFNREELAAFLCSERSSVSRELSKLSEEGKIRIRGNQIELRGDP
ncbi:MAG: Crp/Fnr family transcriptional regulator [Lachnospiraceae bacterium]|nr:Crp/Fnr family transcriptional regulator [Lachnospiraceae bacterium]